MTKFPKYSEVPTYHLPFFFFPPVHFFKLSLSLPPTRLTQSFFLTHPREKVCGRKGDVKKKKKREWVGCRLSPGKAARERRRCIKERKKSAYAEEENFLLSGW